MIVIQSPDEWKEIRKTISDSGFVPTMGNLHAGHASLLTRAKKENAVSILSIFINPTQFNDKKDYERYPKTLANDLHIAEQCGVDYVFVPNKEDMYPDKAVYQIAENDISLLLEGKHRPGHFSGVLTIVMKLFSLIQPTRAYFGEKDYQQLQLVKGLVTAFFLDIEIIACPTVRQDNGLALSSRNTLLNAAELTLAAQLSNFLLSGLDEASIRTKLGDLGFEVEYIEKWQQRLLAAVKIGNIRLIDNIALTGESSCSCV